MKNEDMATFIELLAQATHDTGIVVTDSFETAATLFLSDGTPIGFLTTSETSYRIVSLDRMTTWVAPFDAAVPTRRDYSA